jgi:hypothetical protein
VATTHLSRRLDALEQVFASTGGGCGHWLHTRSDPFVTWNGGPEPQGNPCPGCGEPRPLAIVNLIVVERRER